MHRIKYEISKEYYPNNNNNSSSIIISEDQIST